MAENERDRAQRLELLARELEADNQAELDRSAELRGALEAFDSTTIPDNIRQILDARFGVAEPERPTASLAPRGRVHVVAFMRG